LLQDGVEAGEPAYAGVVGAGADDVQAGGGVGGLVQEGVVVDPGDGGAAGGAVGGLLPPGGDLGGVAEGQQAGALLVADLISVGGAAAWEVEVADAGGGAGDGVEGDLLAGQVQVVAPGPSAAAGRRRRRR
jgi:hypothetical protein